MHLVELFLPLHDHDNRPFEAELFDRVRKELMELFGGVTIYARSPVKGEWKPLDGEKESDELIIFEVMTGNLKTAW